MRVFTLPLLCALFLTPVCASAGEAEEAFRSAEARIAHLERITRVPSKARYAYDEMVAAAASLRALTPPPAPVPAEIPPDAAAKKSDAIRRENEKRRRQWANASSSFERRRAQLTKRWLGSMKRILLVDLGKMRNGMDFDLTINRRAVALLAECKQPAAATVLTKAIQTWQRRGELILAARFHLAAFDALPRFESGDVLEWLVKTYIGKERDQPAPTHVVRRTGGAITEEFVADIPLLALRAVARHDKVSGAQRRSAVQRLVTVYAKIEEERGGADAESWERIGAAAINAAWSLSGKPKDDFAAVPPTMLELADWFRAHRSADDAAWQD